MPEDDMKIVEIDGLLEIVGKSPRSRAAAHENTIRYRLAEDIQRLRTEKGLSIRALAEIVGTSKAQIKRHEGKGLFSFKAKLHDRARGITLALVVFSPDVADLPESDTAAEN